MNSSSTERAEIRRFGLIAFIFFGALFGLAVWRDKALLAWLFGVLCSMGVAFFLLPVPLQPLYVKWLKIGHFMGQVTTAIILTLAYYLVITPTAFIKRLFGGRPLPTAPDRNASTYWVTRPEPAQPKERFIKRY
ncbi:MAG: hypothetical protein JXL84_18640 [Deltaproteobacteria bacterium]|nr:hypothetical protein [Deltaproteobacteria bacterium]